MSLALAATGLRNSVTNFLASSRISMMLLSRAKRGARGKDATNNVTKPNWMTGQTRRQNNILERYHYLLSAWWSAYDFWWWAWSASFNYFTKWVDIMQCKSIWCDELHSVSSHIRFTVVLLFTFRWCPGNVYQHKILCVCFCFCLILRTRCSVCMCV